MPDSSILFTPLALAHGRPMRNRFMLAPLTNLQSEEDGRISDDELHWLRMRAVGGFGLVMTCAAYVDPAGRGFDRQLGIADDRHLEGLSRLAAAVKAQGALAAVQIYHGGSRAVAEVERVSSSDDPETGARALTTAEVEAVVEAFAAAARRAEAAGFDGVELHGAHGYLFSQFFAPRFNRRDDRYGGSLENRSRLYLEVIDAIRGVCGPQFQIGLRISPDRFGTALDEDVALAAELLKARLDYLDLSVTDVRRMPTEPRVPGKPLLSYFTELERGGVRMGAAGMIASGALAAQLVDEGLDYVALGQAAILHHDFPRAALADPGFAARARPVSPQYLSEQGLGPRFIDYMRSWPEFVDDQAAV